MPKTLPVVDMSAPVCCSQSPPAAGRRCRVGDRTAPQGARRSGARQLVSLLFSSSAGEACSGDLAEAVGLSESTVSHHLSQLRRAGLVESERRGMNIYHRPRRDALDGPVHRARPELLRLDGGAIRCSCVLSALASVSTGWGARAGAERTAAMAADTTETGSAATLQPTEQMWREMLPKLRTFVRRRIANPNRADDLVAEILLRIHQNLGSLADQERLPNWMFRIARNAIIDEYRRAGRSREQLRTPCRRSPLTPR